MSQHRTGRAASAVSLLAVALLLPTYSAGSEYRLQAGDVIEIAVAGIPELRHRVSVQLDGSITFPLAGTLSAEGSPIAQIRNRIQSAIASKVIRTRSADGREFSRTIERDDIAATIVDYRPIFVSGDVTKTGEQPFRPRMLVRQALASAGGALSSGRSGLDAATLRSEYVSAWLNYVTGLAREWRIKLELNPLEVPTEDLRRQLWPNDDHPQDWKQIVERTLGQNASFQFGGIASAPVAESVVKRITDLELESLALRQTDHQQSKSYLAQSLRLLENQIAALVQEQESEEQGLLDDSREYKKAKDAYGAGNLPSRRVAEQRRAVLTTSSRLLQTTSQLMQARRSQAETARDLQKIDGQHRIKLLAELQDVQHKLNVERTRLQGAEDKLSAAGMRLPRPNDRASAKVEIKIFRNGMSGQERLLAQPDTELYPGDLIEVGLRDSVELIASSTSNETNRWAHAAPRIVTD